MDDSDFSITGHEAPEEDCFNYVYKIDTNEFVFYVKDGWVCYTILNNLSSINTTKWINWADSVEYFKNYLKNSFVKKLYEHSLFETGKPPVTKLIRKIRAMHKRSSWGQKQEGVAYV
jgi:hypothetical protein